MIETYAPIVVAQIAIAQIATFASLLLLAAAVHKLTYFARASRAVHELTGLTGNLARCAVLCIAAAELVAATGLWLAPARLDAALLAALIWSGYFVFLLTAVVAGRRDFDCGCSFGAAHGPPGLFQLLRAVMLALLALLVAFSAAIAPGSIAYDVSVAAIATQLLAGVALLALYVALDQVMMQQPLRAGVVA